MKQILLAIILLPFITMAQNPVTITGFNQYGIVRGGIQTDSAFTCIMGDTISPNIKFPNQRRIGREMTLPGTFRKYVWDGTKWRPYNTFLPSMETKLNGIQSGATANQTDVYLLDLSNHTGTLSYSMITDVPNLSVYMKYVDTLSLSNRINSKLNKSDTTGKWYPRNGNPDGFFQTINFNSTFDTRFGTKTTSNLTEGSNLYYTNARVQSFSDTRYLQTEVDGSVTNEIELPNQSGQSGKILSTNGSSPSWVTSNTGTVISVTAGTGLSGGTFTTSGTISMPNTGTPGTYGLVTTDSQGRVISGKRQETYSGTTNASGTFTVTFSTAYSVAPNIQANIINGTDTQNIRITSISTTGFTVTVRNRTDVVGLLPSWSNVNGANVDVLITEK